MKITLSKALSLKKRLVGEIDRLGKIISANNSWRVENGSTYDIVNDVYPKYLKAKDDLSRIKTAINAANHPIQAGIFKLAELKDTIVTLKKIEPKKGKHFESTSKYGSESVEINFDCAFDRKTLDNMIVTIQDEIDELQSELDAFNAVNHIDFDL